MSQTPGGAPDKYAQKTPTVSFRQGLVANLPRLERFALTLCRNTTDAGDLTQNTCVRALSRWGQFAPDTRMQSWLFAIMHSIWKNDLRRSGNQSRAHREMALLSARNVAENSVVGKIELFDVLSAMKALSVDQAAAISLISLEGLSYAEASAVLEIPQGTLESRIARGRIALGRMLDGENEMGRGSPVLERKKACNDSDR